MSGENVEPGQHQPPPYDQCITMEDEQSMQTATADTATLVPAKGHPPAYPGHQPGTNPPMSTAHWPAGGGYAGPVAGAGPAGPPQTITRTVVVQRQPVTVVAAPQRDNFWRSYAKMRLAICCTFLAIKIVVIIVVVSVLSASN